MQLSIVETIVPKADFEAFWSAWGGKRQQRKLCALHWSHMLHDDQLAAIAGAKAWSPLFLKREPEFRPCPLKWLQGDRWEDEIPKPVKSLAAAHVPFVASPAYVKDNLPDSIRQLAEKMRR